MFQKIITEDANKKLEDANTTLETRQLRQQCPWVAEMSTTIDDLQNKGKNKVRVHIK